MLVRPLFIHDLNRKVEACVDTVEHLLSAMAGLGIDNVYVELSKLKCQLWMAVLGHL